MPLSTVVCFVRLFLCLIVEVAKTLDEMSDEVVEVVGNVGDLEDGQYVDVSLLTVNKISFLLAYTIY